MRGDKAKLNDTVVEADGWKAIYNGENLEGWHLECHPEDKGKKYWKPGEGYIECNSLGQPDHDYIWLTSDEEFDDFELRLEFQVFESSPGNSGVQFRSRYDTSDQQSKGGWLNGPQVDIHPPVPFRTGLIYDETRSVQRWIYPSLSNWEIIPDSAPPQARETILSYADCDTNAWNNLEMICRGMEIQTLVNGRRVTQFNANGILNDQNHKKLRVGTKGHIALQLHAGDEILIRFRNIYTRKTVKSTSND